MESLQVFDSARATKIEGVLTDADVARDLPWRWEMCASLCSIIVRSRSASRPVEVRSCFRSLC